MSRAYVVYILMFAMLAGGLWVIIELGGALRAPDDLSGEWTVAWNDAGSETLRIDQSGKFFVLRLGNAKPISMTLQPGWKGARDGRRLRMQLAGDKGAKLNISGDVPLNSWRVPVVEVELVLFTPHSGRAVRRGMETTTRPGAPGVAHAR